jgi:hypothetical protein
VNDALVRARDAVPGFSGVKIRSAGAPVKSELSGAKCLRGNGFVSLPPRSDRRKRAPEEQFQPSGVTPDM